MVYSLSRHSEPVWLLFFCEDNGGSLEECWRSCFPYKSSETIQCFVQTECLFTPNLVHVCVLPNETHHNRSDINAIDYHMTNYDHMASEDFNGCVFCSWTAFDHLKLWLYGNKPHHHSAELLLLCLTEEITWNDTGLINYDRLFIFV